MRNNYAMTRLINRSGYLCYNKDIARLKGVNVAVLFAELINIADMFNGEEFFFEQEKIANDTGLSKYQIQEATKSLVADKVLFIKKKGMPCKNWYTIDIEAILQIIENSRVSNKEIESQEVEKLDLRSQEIRPKKSNNSTATGEKISPPLNREIQREIQKEIHTKEKENPCASEQFFPELSDEQQSELLTDQNKYYSRLVFDVWEKAQLPGHKKGFLNFHIRDFRLALSDLHNQHLHSDDVIQACKNYATVIDLKRQGKTWWTSESLFYNFVKPKTIGQFLPDSFDIERFKDNGKKTGSAISRSSEYDNVEIDF